MVGIVDYGSGNFSSVFNAVTSIHPDVKAIVRPQDFDSCSHIILPGVGAYKAAMEKITSLNLMEELHRNVIEKKKPFLGICVGMQILSDRGFEFEVSEGLGWISMEVHRFEFSQEQDLFLPHIGWNEVIDYQQNILFRDIQEDDPSFYFVHSYHLRGNDPQTKLTMAKYGYEFIAAVQKDNIFGVQFHPEKSQTNGLQLLRNFVTLNG